MSKKNRIGYTTGVFDLFHIGHVNLLKNAKSMCDKLIVGVSTDEVVEKIKNKKPVVPFNERVEILKSVIYTDVVVSQELDSYLDKKEAWERYKFDTMFVGDDWKGKERWNKIEKEFKELKVGIVYLPYTKSTSSTTINKILEDYLW